MKKHFIIFVYNSYRDPLCQGILLSYVRAIRQPQFVYHLITFEQSAFALTPSEMTEEKKMLAQQGIIWYPQRFSTGRMLLLKKLRNMLSAFWLVRTLKRQCKPRLVVAMANVAGSMAYVITRMVRMPLCIYSFEPHSDFMAEAGVWSKQSLKYKVLHFIEWRAGCKAEVIMTGTRHMMQKLKSLGARGRLMHLPTAADENIFQFNEEARKRIRARHGIDPHRPVLIYPGKLGDLYIKREIAVLCGALKQIEPQFYFMLLTAWHRDELLQWLCEEGVDEADVFIGRVPYHEMPAYLSAADLGLVGIAGFPSRVYCSPTKVGEYLLCGLPFIVQRNTGDDDALVQANRTGVVIDEFSRGPVLKEASKLRELLSESKESLRARCRGAALHHRSRERIVHALTSLFHSA